MLLHHSVSFGLFFFYNGKNFCLRGGQEHREMKLSQLEKLTDPERYLYRENSSKNRQGGLKDMRLEHKSVTIVADPNAGTRCHVYLLNEYISKLPSEAVAKDLFYCRPLQSVVSDSSKQWYSAVPMGRNTLDKIVSVMCKEAGIKGTKSNHSLRVTGTSALFDAGVPEKIIQSRTGHKSLDALRVYERVTSDQEVQVSKISSGSVDKFGENGKSMNSGACAAPPSHGGQFNYCTVNMYQMPPWMPVPYSSFPAYPQAYGPTENTPMSNCPPSSSHEN